MLDNTFDKYFDMAQDNVTIYRGRSRVFHPTVTEVSYGAAAVCSWLSRNSDNATIASLQERLRESYSRHPRGGWTEQSQLSLSGDIPVVINTPSWAAALRTLPIASFLHGNLKETLNLAESCVLSTCSDEDTILAGRIIAHTAFLCHEGRSKEEIRDVLTREYSLILNKSREDLREELQGKVRVPLEYLGREIDGAYSYITPQKHLPLSPKVIVEAAVTALLNHDDWEDTVRNAVVLGGPSNAVAGLAGGFAEIFYGEVTPKVIGRFVAMIPTDLSTSMDIYAKRRIREIEIKTDPSATRSLQSQSLPIISLGPGQTVYVVPKERDDISGIIRSKFPNPTIIQPDAISKYLINPNLNKSGTYLYAPIPEQRILYIQDSKDIVSPSTYVAPGMPPLQQREKHLVAFQDLRRWCINKQQLLNGYAGNPLNCQIHYSDAYHFYIGSNKIDILMGDFLAGRIRIDGRGLLRVDMGEYRDIGLDSRFENHMIQSWENAPLFTTEMTSDPISHLMDIKSALGKVLDQENIDRLETLSESEVEKASVGKYDVSPDSISLHKEEPVRKQATKTVYTIGYGLRSQKQIIDIIHSQGIDTVIDVRSFRNSDKNPSFSESNLCDAFEANRISYINGGDLLGPKQESENLLDENGRVIWDRVRQTEDHSKGIEAIERLASEGQLVVLMSAESDPLTSHRFGLIAKDLHLAGYDVKHILRSGEIVSHTVLEDRLLQKYIKENRISTVMTGSYSKQLQEAYKVMNDKYGYQVKRKISLRR